MLAKFQSESNDYYGFLKKKLAETAKDKDKLAILEALGVLGNPEAIPLLESYFYGSPILSYTATAAILKIWGRISALRDKGRSNSKTPEVLGELPLPVTPEDFFVKYLKDPKLSALSKQMVLRQMIRKGILLKRAFGEDKSPLEELLISQLKDPNMNIRYLSTQALLLINAESAFEPMVESLLIESDPTTLKLLRQSILSLLSLNPDLIIRVLEKNKEREKPVRILLYALLEAPLNGTQALKIIPQLFGPPLNFMGSPYAGDCVAFVFIQVLKNNVDLRDLLHVVEDIPNKEILLRNLVDYFRAHPHAKIPLPVDTLKEWLSKKEESSLGPIIDLLGLSHNRGAIPLLVSSAVDPSYKPFHPKIVEAINHLVWQAS